MSGIKKITALEILTNPNNLEIIIGQQKSSGKYAIAIMRGPGHNFKMLLSSEPVIEDFEDVLKTVKETLEAIQQAMTKKLENPESIIGLIGKGMILNADNQTIDHSKVLNSDLINRIVDELREHKIASTYKMKVGAS